jgi:hypothetical protein
MKTLIKVFVGLGMMLLTATHANPQAQSQDYKTGIGVRLGGLTSGLTVKGFLNQNSALEGILSFGYRTSVITGLYEKHNNINNAPGVKWFYGGGAHMGFFSYGAHYYYYSFRGDRIYVLREGESAVVGGLDFILGMEYKFKGAPFSVGLDMKPFIDFYNVPSAYWDGALTLRFAF